jgi:hypothetical protein
MREIPVWADRPCNRGSQSYAVLTAARSWATVTTGKHLSKQEGAALACHTFLHHAALIERALIDREHPDRHLPASAHAIAATIQLARELVLAVPERADRMP